ncbi:hypothetical protein GQ55_3G211400 [Panicum hallii var. hallii]|uniref:Uncharacterized protein n=1 Tax=Panicum hallii var. hallii TaxID=1504633 RepID=A0A2T7EBU7_9POAL|nr:hypothetical protein GQ55_3G211400 [Panicum hallii var. hallii]
MQAGRRSGRPGCSGGWLPGAGDRGTNAGGLIRWLPPAGGRRELRKTAVSRQQRRREKLPLRLHIVYQPGAPKASGFAIGGVPVEIARRSNPKIAKEFNHQTGLGSNGDTYTGEKNVVSENRMGSNGRCSECSHG